ncbi:diaminobutyrate acetyltransferase [Methyloprofundus sedimenti]|uniref:diaminobutyrate acetyltransferase n=1 Tax=Methyloprofundus sedimenti TaxID=1420851 RepID=UPI001E3C6EE2|nr:diaminobutyrate acetyltransferase [Methyloprofundus sedimenti]
MKYQLLAYFSIKYIIRCVYKFGAFNIKSLVIDLRQPLPEDGSQAFKLISQCPPLDTNSLYCNLLQCSHFSCTSVAAVAQDEVVGFISAYVVPDRPNTLFVWQVAVGTQARGQGLATRMLQHILDRPLCNDIRYLETTITESNQASWALFNGLSSKLNTELHSSVMFDRKQHLDNAHDTEMLVKIGPFNIRKEINNENI